MWLTNGNLLYGGNPELSLVFGFANVVMIEQPSFRLATIDFDPDELNQDSARIARLVLEQETALERDRERTVDNHLIVKAGVPYMSRYVLDDLENRAFDRQARQVIEKQAFGSGLELDFRQVGDVESFYFRETKMKEGALEDKQVLLEPMLYGLSSTVSTYLILPR
jgi:hypothetical protein